MFGGRQIRRKAEVEAALRSAEVGAPRALLACFIPEIKLPRFAPEPAGLIKSSYFYAVTVSAPSSAERQPRSSQSNR